MEELLLAGRKIFVYTIALKEAQFLWEENWTFLPYLSLLNTLFYSGVTSEVHV